MAHDPKLLKPSGKAQKPSKKPVRAKKEASLLTKPGLNSPGLLFLLVLVPVLFGILMSLIREPEAEVQPQAGKETIRTLPDEPALWERPQAPQSSVSSAGGVPAASRGANACNFNDLIGIMPDERLFARLQQAGKAYRVLKPGAQITMDYSADRVNLELDDQGVIQRVWCG
jgi:hypothetical protein